MRVPDRLATTVARSPPTTQLGQPVPHLVMKRGEQVLKSRTRYRPYAAAKSWLIVPSWRLTKTKARPRVSFAAPVMRQATPEAWGDENGNRDLHTPTQGVDPP